MTEPVQTDADDSSASASASVRPGGNFSVGERLN